LHRVPCIFHTTMAAFRPIVGVALLVGAWWASSAFVPSVFANSRADGQTAALRGASVGSADTDSRQSGASFGVVAPLGIALLGVAAMSRQQRSPAVSRRFFGGASTPSTPKQPTSYKDYVDNWLGSERVLSADLGFDPLNVAVGSVFDKGTAVMPETTYYNYRESEVKHGRFAMAAFLAIFFEQADRDALLQQLGFSNAVDNLDATLGLDELQAPVLLIGLGAQALAEYSKQRKENDGSFLSVEFNRERCPGDLGFDPLGFALGNSPKQLVEFHNVEVNLGRLAMIGATSFIFKEFLIKDADIASRIL